MTRAQIHVTALGASNDTFASATASQTAEDWVRALISRLGFISGEPTPFVPDQARALVARPDHYAPVPTRLLEAFCQHYDVAVLPARPAHPRVSVVTR